VTAASFTFAVHARDPQSGARAGILTTPHGDVDTPVFMPVGTAGAVKAVTFAQVREAGFRLILGNTYHLYLRPGHDLIGALGGLHRFQGWDGALLTDSAGFQVFSLAKLNQVTEDGVRLRSHLDGSAHFFTPELSMQIQRALGADIAMAFDHCLPYGAEPREVARAVERTTRWAERCVAAFGATGRADREGCQQVLFGIVQGGVDEALRRLSATQLRDLDLPGYAIGGLSVGEPPAAMHAMCAFTAPLLPPERPRYLMGVGFPDDILAGVAAGVDMFDCVLPTRMARTGTVMTRDGRLVVKNSEHARAELPLDAECGCPVCARHSRAYLRHLFQVGEMLGPMLATLHNLWFYGDLMREVRAAIAGGGFATLAHDRTARWREGEAARLAGVERRGSGA
jgi:queuine tRNA-ribosyltransferase